jgi:hypothetical protein
MVGQHFLTFTDDGTLRRSGLIVDERHGVYVVILRDWLTGRLSGDERAVPIADAPLWQIFDREEWAWQAYNRLVRVGRAG